MSKISINFNSILTAISAIEFILWSMGKVPYGFLCWLIPLAWTIALNILDNIKENA